eukprot:363626-Chlamydomonas_euryale.AAC.6
MRGGRCAGAVGLTVCHCAPAIDVAAEAIKCVKSTRVCAARVKPPNVSSCMESGSGACGAAGVERSRYGHFQEVMPPRLLGQERTTRRKSVVVGALHQGPAHTGRWRLNPCKSA